MTATGLAKPGFWQRFGLRIAMWARRHGVARRLAIGLTIAALISGIATYVVLTGSPLGSGRSPTLLALIIIDMCLLLPLTALIGYRLVRLWSDRRRKSAGSRLQGRLVLLFSVLAVVPAIIIVVFSALFFNFGIDSWFSSRVGRALTESITITERYLTEKQKEISEKVRDVRRDLDEYTLAISVSPRGFQRFALQRFQENAVTDAAVFDKNGKVIVSVGNGRLFPYEPRERIQAGIAQLKKNDVVIITTAKSANMRALTKLSVYLESPLYLYVSTSIDPALLGNIASLQQAVTDYVQLKERRSVLEIGFFLLFAIVSLLLLFAAIWLGMLFANQLARPISALINAADRVAAGDLKARVPERQADDEIGILSRAFNRMTGQLSRNRKDLLEANRQIDARRQFTETVLAGVSAGVIGLDEAGRINLPNRSASDLLGLDLREMIDQPLAEVVPEMAELMNRILANPARPERAEVMVARGGDVRTLLVRIAAEQLEENVIGFVVTFDDITDLQAAQRLAAWADVARRVAHEIKNPLTPIQLSAERLRRKYLKEIQSDPETFETCTDTIVRQVGDIGRLVDEFSSFARMPRPVMAEEDLREVCRQAVFLQRQAHGDIAIEMDLPDQPVRHTCDRRQIAQALTNILKNAAEAVTESDDGGKREIHLRLVAAETGAEVIVDDTGAGLPGDLQHRLTEPYITTREKGTGLGLAIVRKIMEDHGGDLILQNRPDGTGARAVLSFPPEEADVSQSDPATPVDLPSEAAE